MMRAVVHSEVLLWSAGLCTAVQATQYIIPVGGPLSPPPPPRSHAPAPPSSLGSSRRGCTAAQPIGRTPEGTAPPRPRDRWPSPSTFGDTEEADRHLRSCLQSFGGAQSRDVLEVGEGDLKGRGVGGVGWNNPPPRVPLWSPPKAGQKKLSVNPLGAEGAEAKFWLSAPKIGRGGRGGRGPRGGGGGPLLLQCTAVLIHHRVSPPPAPRPRPPLHATRAHSAAHDTSM